MYRCIVIPKCTCVCTLKGTCVMSYQKVPMLCHTKRYLCYVIPKGTCVFAHQKVPVLCHTKGYLCYVIPKDTYVMSYQNASIFMSKRKCGHTCRKPSGIIPIGMYALSYQKDPSSIILKGVCTCCHKRRI